MTAAVARAPAEARQSSAAGACAACGGRGAGPGASPGASAVAKGAPAQAGDGRSLCEPCREAWQAQEKVDAKVAEQRRAKERAVADLEEEARAAAAVAREVAATRAAAARARAAARPRGGAADARRAASGPEEPPRFFLAASTDGWVPHEMLWNEARRRFLALVPLGGDGRARFRVLVDGDPEKCIHPEQEEGWSPDASVAGPSPNAGGNSWVIGERQADEGSSGAFYEVQLRVGADGDAQAAPGPAVSWRRLLGACAGVGGANAVRKYWVRGTWDEGAQHEMHWDPVRQVFHYNVRIREAGSESFQILVHNRWFECLYPEEDDGTFYQHALCGPDSLGSDKRWVIGKHALDGAAAGVWYEIRLRVSADGKPRDVDWIRLGPREQDTPVLFRSSQDDGAELFAAWSNAEAHEECLNQESEHEDGQQQAATAAAATQEGQAAEAAPRSEGAELVRAQLKKDLAMEPLAPRGGAPRTDRVLDSDGEELVLCSACGLPLGGHGYARAERAEGRPGLVHAECMARLVLEDLQEEDKGRLDEDGQLKRAKRAAYDIGWCPDRVPTGTSVLGRLQCSNPPEGMCCLLLDEAAKSVHVAATAEPAESVNLAYLSLALQVRLREGREALFSLDPPSNMEEASGAVEDSAHRDAWMQVKRFEPPWLAGTSVGEVMFQADYHLKELSMGECRQPVLGMRSAHDYSEGEAPDCEWNAREWFIVRKAAVYCSEGGALIPYVKMGVEAREQVKGPRGLEDAKITRADHPLVRYAEAFTEKFDLIAERKSVIYHLRALARASVLAKFLTDAKLLLDASWFALADEELAPCIMEVPQLWNERCYSKIRVKDGKLEDERTCAIPRVRGVYGGADLGLDQFRLGQVAPVPGVPPLAPGQLRPPPGVRAIPHRGVRLNAARLAQQAVTPVQALSLAGLSFEGAPEPQGVDLNLRGFDFSSPAPAARQAKVGTWAHEAFILPSGAVCVEAFWAKVGGAEHDETGLSADDAGLLRDLFCSELSDRRAEGPRFVPPDTSFAYVHKLRALLKDESKVKQQRRKLFLSADFDVDKVGDLFPSSWVSKMEVLDHTARQTKRSQGAQRSALQARPEYRDQSESLMPAIQAARPAFDKATEDGVRFRIYRLGGLQVRSVQAPGGEEVIGAVFALAPAPAAAAAAALAVGPGARDGLPVWANARITKATEYVERDADGPPSSRHYFVVFETPTGDAIVTEKTRDGAVLWRENLAQLSARTSAAKVIDAGDCAQVGVAVADMRLFLAKISLPGSGSSRSSRKRYAHDAFQRATTCVDPILRQAVEGRGMGNGPSKGAGKGRAPGFARPVPLGPGRAIRMPSTLPFESRTRYL